MTGAQVVKTATSARAISMLILYHLSLVPAGTLLAFRTGAFNGSLQVWLYPHHVLHTRAHMDDQGAVALC